MGKPVKKFQHGAVQAAVWENEFNGKKNYSVTFQKSFKDKDGNWKQTDSFYDNDLKSLYFLIQTMIASKTKVYDDQPKQEPAQKGPANDSIPF